VGTGAGTGVGTGDGTGVGTGDGLGGASGQRRAQEPTHAWWITSSSVGHSDTQALYEPPGQSLGGGVGTGDGVVVGADGHTEPHTFGTGPFTTEPDTTTFESLKVEPYKS